MSSAVEIPVRTELVALAAWLIAMTLAMTTRAESASAPRAQLVVTRGAGAEDCPDASLLSTRIRGMSTADVAVSEAPTPRDTWVEVELSRVLSGYRATISARGRRNGSRTIDDVGPSCTSLSDAVAITLVMLLDPQGAQETTAPSPASPEVLPTPSEEPRRAFTAGVEGTFGASLAVLEHPVPVLELGARADIGERFGVAAGGGLVFPDRVAVAGGSVKLGLFYGYLRGSAALFERASTRLVFVAGPALGSLSGEGSGYDVPMPSQRLLWLAVAGGPELRAALATWLAWSVRLLAVVPLVHQGFSVNDAGKPTDAFETPPVGVALTFGVVADL